MRHRARLALGLAVVGAVLVGAAYASHAGALPLPLPGRVSVPPPGEPDPLNRGELNSVLGPDAIAAIDNPSFLPAARGSSIPASVPIIGVVLNGEAHAYPIPLLSSHEIVNDRLGGTDIAVTW